MKNIKLSGLYDSLYLCLEKNLESGGNLKMRSKGIENSSGLEN